MTDRSALALILAAGKGTRMKSALPKVLHPLAGAPMLEHVLKSAGAAGFSGRCLVVTPGMEAVKTLCHRLDSGAEVVVQPEPLGTANAVLAARAILERLSTDVVVLFGDTPLMRPQTLAAVRKALADGADIVVLGFEAADPTGYGRLILDDEGEVAAICEEKDASKAERAITLCNSGVMGFRAGVLPALAERIGCDNAKGEYYLTDAVALARADGLKVVLSLCEEQEVLGINSREQLAQAEAVLQWQLRMAAMENGATLLAPESVFFSHDTSLGQDVLVEPNVVFGPGVTVKDNATIRAFSHLEGAVVQEGAIVGPFARLRPGTDIGREAHIGNFVEVKNAVIEESAKANHLAYLGDTRVGAKANIGAGTITCNYDGFAKHKTDIGAGAFIGTNSALIAPISIGDGAYVGTGSILSKDVPADALVLTRAPLTQRDGWAAKMRERHARSKRNDGK